MTSILLVGAAPTVITWNDAPGDWDVPLGRVNLSRSAPGLAAHLAAAELRARPPGRRVLILDGLFLRGNFPRDPATVLARGIELEPDRAGCREFFASLRQRGIELDRLVLDMEDGVSVWHFFGKHMADEQRVALFKPIFTRPELRARLPAALRVFNAEDFAWRAPRSPDAYLAWDRFARELTCQALREAVLDPARASFGADLPASNYQDVNPARPVADLNGWPMDGALTPAISSPELYLWIGNEQRRQAKDPRWNRLVQCLNVVRGCLATPGQRVEPWISSPSFAGDDLPPFEDRWLWEQLVRHLAESGVSTFLFWNPRPPPADREGTRRWESDVTLARDLFTSLRPAPPQRNLPGIPYDTDEIVTGTLRTTYDEFLRRYPSPDSRGVPSP